MSWIRAAAAIAGTLVVLAWAIVRPEQLYVERVVFDGQVRSTPVELRHLADLRNGTTIWGVDLDRVSSGVQRHPWVKRATAERHLPGTVSVHVEEYTPVALLAYDDGLFYVDADGEPFLRAHTDDLDHPVITGVDPALEAAHPELPRLAIRDALWLIDQLDGRQLLPRSQISEVRFHRTRGFTVLTSGGQAGHGTAEVLFGLGDYEHQLRRLTALLDRGVDLSQPVHVDLGARTVAIVRPLDDGDRFLSQ